MGYVTNGKLPRRGPKIMKMKRPNPRSFSILIVNFHDLYSFAVQNSRQRHSIFDKVHTYFFEYSGPYTQQHQLRLILNTIIVCKAFFTCVDLVLTPKFGSLSLNDGFTHTVLRVYSECTQTVLRLYQPQITTYSISYDPLSLFSCMKYTMHNNCFGELLGPPK